MVPIKVFPTMRKCFLLGFVLLVTMQQALGQLLNDDSKPKKKYILPISGSYQVLGKPTKPNEEDIDVTEINGIVYLGDRYITCGDGPIQTLRGYTSLPNSATNTEPDITYNLPDGVYIKEARELSADDNYVYLIDFGDSDDTRAFVTSRNSEGEFIKRGKGRLAHARKVVRFPKSEFTASNAANQTLTGAKIFYTDENYTGVPRDKYEHADSYEAAFIKNNQMFLLNRWAPSLGKGFTDAGTYVQTLNLSNTFTTDPDPDPIDDVQVTLQIGLVSAIYRGDFGLIVSGAAISPDEKTIVMVGNSTVTKVGSVFGNLITIWRNPTYLYRNDYGNHYFEGGRKEEFTHITFRSLRSHAPFKAVTFIDNNTIVVGTDDQDGYYDKGSELIKIDLEPYLNTENPHSLTISSIENLIATDLTDGADQIVGSFTTDILLAGPNPGVETVSDEIEPAIFSGTDDKLILLEGLTDQNELKKRYIFYAYTDENDERRVLTNPHRKSPADRENLLLCDLSRARDNYPFPIHEDRITVDDLVNTNYDGSIMMLGRNEKDPFYDLLVNSDSEMYSSASSDLGTSINPAISLSGSWVSSGNRYEITQQTSGRYASNARDTLFVNFPATDLGYVLAWDEYFSTENDYDFCSLTFCDNEYGCQTMVSTSGLSSETGATRQRYQIVRSSGEPIELAFIFESNQSIEIKDGGWDIGNIVAYPILDSKYFYVPEIEVTQDTTIVNQTAAVGDHVIDVTGFVKLIDYTHPGGYYTNVDYAGCDKVEVLPSSSLKKHTHLTTCGTGSNPITLQVRTDGFAMDWPEAGQRVPGSELLIYPNPVSNGVAISYELKAPQEVRISLYSIQGQLLETLNKVYVDQTGKHTYNIDDLNISPGIYLIKIDLGSEGSFLSKIVKK